MRPFDCHQVCPNRTLRSDFTARKPPKIETPVCDMDMSQRSKRAIISKTKETRYLESVLIDSWGDFTPKVTSIRDSRVKFQIPGAEMVVTRVRAHGPIEHQPWTGRIKLICQHVVPMVATSWHSDHWSRCFCSWVRSHKVVVTRARMDQILQNYLGLRPHSYFNLVYPWQLQVDGVRTWLHYYRSILWSIATILKSILP